MALRLPQDLLRTGFERSPVVMMNEAHDGLRRCTRTRAVGRELLSTAHRLGVRNLAMEALWDRDFTAEANRDRRLPEGSGYLAQPEMRAFIQSALDLGWTLLAYEADMSAAPSTDLMSQEVTNWREREQARNLAAVLPEEPVLVWCGNGHLSKRTAGLSWRPMAQCFQELAGIEPFSLDQTVTVLWGEKAESWVDEFRAELEAIGGTGGFLTEDAPAGWHQKWADAYLLSLDNELVE